MSGYVTFPRALLDDPVFAGNAERLGAWLWLIGKACWKPSRFAVPGTTLTLERGQVCVSRSQLAKAWGMSPSAVERFLTRLETGQLIGRATGQGRTVVTIYNYDIYQGSGEETGQPAGQLRGQEPDSNRTAKEEGKRKKEEEPNGSSPREPTKRKCRLPENWHPAPLPSDLAQSVASSQPDELDSELANFRDWHRAKGTLNLDWNAAWRIWLRKHLKERRFAHGTVPFRTQGARSFRDDASLAAIGQQVAEQRAERRAAAGGGR
jgi:hypothetical protein